MPPCPPWIMSITFAPFWRSLPAVEWHGRTYVYRPWITQTLLFSCKCDQLDIAPEDDPSCLVHRAMLRIGYTARTTVASAWCLYALGVSVRVVYMNAELVKPVLSQMSLASRNDPRRGRCLKCLSLHCIDCVSAGKGTLSSQKDQHWA